jgi:hypothetical protein
MAVAVIGSRTFRDYELLTRVLDRYQQTVKISLIISGGAAGADKLAEIYAKERGIKTSIMKPDWKKHGKVAGILNNVEIVTNANAVFAFWDGKSRGTQDAITKTKILGKPLVITVF